MNTFFIVSFSSQRTIIAVILSPYVEALLPEMANGFTQNPSALFPDGYLAREEGGNVICINETKPVTLAAIGLAPRLGSHASSKVIDVYIFWVDTFSGLLREANHHNNNSILH